MLAALVVIYIVLGMLYESLIHPLTVLSTLPWAGVGAVIALMLARMEFDIIALIGIILLIGIVKKNAILIIDFAIAAERDARLPREAIREARMRRFRPIMMTTLAARSARCRWRSASARDRSCASRWASRSSAGWSPASC